MTIFREEGPAALYKGFVPKVLRLAPGGGVLLLVVEFTLGVFRKCSLLLFLFFAVRRANNAALQVWGHHTFNRRHVIEVNCRYTDHVFYFSTSKILPNISDTIAQESIIDTLSAMERNSTNEMARQP